MKLLKGILLNIWDGIKSKPYLKNSLIGFLIYFCLIFLYSNVTHAAVRSKLSFLNRMFYSPNLSISNQIERYRKKTKEEEALHNTKAYEVKVQSKTPTVNVSGIIEPLEKVEIYSKLSGRVKRIFVVEGQKIKIGQKLAEIDTISLNLELKKQQAAYQASIAQFNLVKEKYLNSKKNIEAKLNEADKKISLSKKSELEYNRAYEVYSKKMELLNSGAISQEEFEASKIDLANKESSFISAKRDQQIALLGFKDEDIKAAGLKIPNDKEEKIRLLKELNTKVEKLEVNVTEKNILQSKANLDSIKIQLNESILVSPIDGVVAARLKSSGELIEGGGSVNSKSIFTLVHIDQVYASFYINEQDINLIKEGMEVVIKTDVYSDRTFKGIVKILSPIIDQRTHTTEIKVLLENKDHSLKPGIFVRLEILTGVTESQIAIPNEAVIPIDEQEGFVFLIRNKTIFKTKVKLGKKENEMIHIKEGLLEKDLVALSNINKLREGMIVNPSLE
jgi:RND family efflux transporter MFP subunit